MKKLGNELRIEKEFFENDYQAFLDGLGKKTPSSEMSRDRNNLIFERIRNGSYRVLNGDTGRFHNPELGIDWVV